MYTTTPTTDTTTPTAVYRFRHLFPVDASRTIILAGHSEPILIHCMMSKAALIQFFTPPLYYILLVGLEAALTDDETTKTSNASSLFSQWLNSIDSTTPTPTHVHTATATYTEDPELIVSIKAYTTPISLITTTATNNNYTVFTR